MGEGHEKRGVVEQGRTPPERPQGEKQASKEPFDHATRRIEERGSEALRKKPD